MADQGRHGKDDCQGLEGSVNCEHPRNDRYRKMHHEVGAVGVNGETRKHLIGRQTRG